MKAFIPAFAVIIVGAVSSITYAPPAKAVRYCAPILASCQARHDDVCDAYYACVEAGGDPVVASTAALAPRKP